MLIASSIVKVPADRAEEVSDLLGRVPGVESFGVYRDTNIIIVTEAHDQVQLEGLFDHIKKEFPEVLVILPSFIADEEAIDAGEPS